MRDSRTVSQTPLEAKSPFELRVDLSKNVPDADVRAALATGDMGFLRSFTTGATVDGQRARRRVDVRVHVAVPAATTRTHGRWATASRCRSPRRRRVAQARQGLKVMAGSDDQRRRARSYSSAS